MTLEKINRTVSVFAGRFFVLVLFFSCSKRVELLNQETYSGPKMEMDTVRTIMTDSGKLVLIIEAPKQLDFEDGDRSFPDGFFLTYFERGDSIPTCELVSNTAYYNSEDNLWLAKGDVEVLNLETQDLMNTEELYWDPNEKIYYTEKFVTIISEGEMHKGEGMTADQNFDSYTIHNPSGSITIDEEE